MEQSIGRPFQSGDQRSKSSILTWRMAQSLVWLLGLAILYCLFIIPDLGVTLFWNVLIPVAPALFVLGMGIWRNVCPLATTNLLPRHFGLSRRKKLSIREMGVLNLIGVVALYAIVPLRHALFNRNGVATGMLIVAMAAIGVTLGFFYEWKSAWCSGLCPIHPVEKLYGGNVMGTLPNAHCAQCMNCVKPCPDSTPNIHPLAATKTLPHRLSGWLTAGGLPGFIWGWFHVPDEAPAGHLLTVYVLPMTGLMVSLALFLILSHIIQPRFERRLISTFAAAGVSCYYWYRIPALLGFGPFAGDGRLVDLTKTIPAWLPLFFSTMATLFFFYWLVVRPRNKHCWIVRPQYAIRAERKITA
jgi:hypothetical protein